MSSATVENYGWQDAAPGSSDYINPAVSAILRRHAPADVLDAGCGNGALVRALRNAGFAAHGIDADQGGVDLARAAAPEARFAVALLASDPAALGFTADGQFDAVVSTEVVEHLYAPHELPQFAWRALRPGGILVISTPYHGYLKNLALALTNSFDKHFTAHWHGGHIKFWSRTTLSRRLGDAGFHIIGFRGVGRLPWLWKSMILIANKPAVAASQTLYTDNSNQDETHAPS